jgi:HEPN domain-containing protein
MALGLRRADLQAIAQAKLGDAELLLAHRRFSNAYYLAGYAVEIGLKACIARQFTAETIPDRRFVADVHSHDLRKLVGLAGLSRELREKETAEPAFAANWALISEWTPEIRYEAVDQFSAQILVQAVKDATAGVLPWIQTYW